MDTIYIRTNILHFPLKIKRPTLEGLFYKLESVYDFILGFTSILYGIIQFSPPFLILFEV